MTRKVGRALAALAVLVVTSPGVVWAAETAVKAVSACCGCGMPCCH
jgi:hypothetical protein